MTAEAGPADRRTHSIGGYSLLELLGRGGMGEVWRAERVGPAGVRRRAALKRILPEQRHDPVLRERFLAEARISAKLEHPNVVQVLDFGDQPELYLVLEYVEGTSLAELMRRAATGRAALPLEAVLYAVAEAAAGLEYAHRKRDESGVPLEIVHRDVSPPNVLVSVDGVVKVSDFGVARARDNTLRTLAGAPPGKLAYMAPEQAHGEPIDGRADVFALGVVLWEALALQPLLPRTSPGATLEALSRGGFPPPSARARGRIPPSVDRIVLEALATDPRVRTPSAARLCEQLRAELRECAPTFDAPELATVVRAAIETAARASQPESPKQGALAERAAEPEAPGLAVHAPRTTAVEIPRARVMSGANAPAEASRVVTPPTRSGSFEPVRAPSAPSGVVGVVGPSPLAAAAPTSTRRASRSGLWIGLGSLVVLAALSVGIAVNAGAFDADDGDVDVSVPTIASWLRELTVRCSSTVPNARAGGSLLFSGRWVAYGPAQSLQVATQPDSPAASQVRSCVLQALSSASAPDPRAVVYLRGLVVSF